MQSNRLQCFFRDNKALLGTIAAVGLLAITDIAFAQETGSKTDLKGIASNLTQSLEVFKVLIISISYLAGLGFSLSAIFKFKAHKDNPTQIPVGTPIALLLIGAALLYLPQLFTTAGESVFGKDADAAKLSATYDTIK